MIRICMYDSKLISLTQFLFPTDLLVKNEVNIESTKASLLTKHKLRDDPWLEQNS